MNIPVYLFTGFLEAGKTKMIDETLSDDRFQDKERTLLIVCEMGIEEFDTSKYKGKVFVKEVAEQTELTTNNLLNWQKENRCNRVVIEYNGMWNSSLLYDAFPEGWIVAQEIALIDASTFFVYNANMRNLMADKIIGCSVVFFNRCDDSTDIERLHKEVRALNRGIEILYTYKDGRVVHDDTKDPLPFDIDDDPIVIKESDYAIWYSDLAEDIDKYVGKTVTFKGIVARDAALKMNSFAIGRMVMTCCIEDLTFHGLICICTENVEIENGEWLEITAKIKKEYSKIYKTTGPVLYAEAYEKTTPPADPIATYF